jgi:V8-like Glu-specific endopeptidase
MAWGAAALLSSCAHQKGAQITNERSGVCRVQARGDGGLFGRNGKGTGALIDGRYAITAAHNLLDDDMGAVDSVEVNGVLAKRWEVASAYRAKQRTGEFKKSERELLEHDFGFIDLGQESATEEGFHMALPAPPLISVGQQVKVAGYPLGGSMVGGSGRITAVRGSFFRYEVGTEKGMSGAPVWIEQKGQKRLVGIHLGSDLVGLEGAVARRIDRPVMREWAQWKSGNFGSE